MSALSGLGLCPALRCGVLSSGGLFRLLSQAFSLPMLLLAPLPFSLASSGASASGNSVVVSAVACWLWASRFRGGCRCVVLALSCLFSLWVFLFVVSSVFVPPGFRFRFGDGPAEIARGSGLSSSAGCFVVAGPGGRQGAGSGCGQGGSSTKPQKEESASGRPPSSGQQELGFRPLPGEEKEAACVSTGGQVIGKRHSATAACVCVCARSTSGGWQQAAAGGTWRAARPLGGGNLDSPSEVWSLGQASLGF